MSTELLDEIRVPAKASQLQAVRARVRKALRRTPLDSEQRDCAIIGINEACMNIIQHAYGSEGEGDMIVQVWLADNELVFRLMDFAAPVDPACIQSRCLDEVRPGGLGVHLIQEVMDEMNFQTTPEGVGNILELRKRLVTRKE